MQAFKYTKMSPDCLSAIPICERRKWKFLKKQNKLCLKSSLTRYLEDPSAALARKYSWSIWQQDKKAHKKKQQDTRWHFLNVRTMRQSPIPYSSDTGRSPTSAEGHVQEQLAWQSPLCSVPWYHSPSTSCFKSNSHQLTTFDRSHPARKQVSIKGAASEMGLNQGTITDRWPQSFLHPMLLRDKIIHKPPAAPEISAEAQKNTSSLSCPAALHRRCSLQM